MPSRRSEVLVTEFLRDALAPDSLGVPELEAMARAKGLLGEGQSITRRDFADAFSQVGAGSP
jgi:hypothetical protein